MKSLDRLFIFITCIIAISSTNTFSQENEEVYGTNTGNLKLISEVNDTLFRAIADKLTVILNYQTAEFTLILDKADLKTENDSINKLLELRKGEEIRFTGKIDLPYIKREKHPPKDIEIKGYLSTDPDKNEILGNGRLEYLFNGRYASMLTMKFIIDVDKMGINIPIENLSNKIEVELRQAVLSKPIN